MSPIRSLVYALVAALFFSGSLNVKADPIDVPSWISSLDSERSKIAAAEPAKQDLAAKESLYRLGKQFPILVDWVMQDAAPSPHSLLLKESANETERRLLLKTGVAEIPETSEARLKLYVERAIERREKRLRPTINRWAPFAFTEMHSIRSSFIGYTEGLSDARHERFFKPGARLTLLHFDGDSAFGRAEHLIDDPHGMIRDVDVSYDNARLLFAWKKSDRLDDYHIYEINLADKSHRQLTKGIGRADYEPVYLPDGDIVFTSTRPEQSVPCWYTEISNLYRMNPDGEYIRRLAIDQVHTLYPQVLNDGRLSYTRWDYSDRGQNYPHPVFSMNPDGQAQRVYYGGNSWFPNSLLHTRAIPGSPKVMSIAAGHHTCQHGKLVVLDVREGRDEGVGMKFVSPVREVAYERVDRAQQHADQFRYPFPLSETELLISYKPDWGFEPVPRHADQNDYALYWMNLDGEREYLHGDTTLGIQRPVAIGNKPAQPIIPDTVDYTKNTGTLYVHDVYKGVGLNGVPRGEAKKLRVVRLNYRAAGIGQTINGGEGGGSINSSPVSIGNGSWDIKEIIGDADIHDDGSVLFEVPANESIYLQVLDARGRVLQTTRTWDTVRPGEQKGCVGCHDKGNANYHPFQKEPTLAWKHGVQKLQPFHGETRGFSFAKDIQPILNKSCVDCHNGATPDLMDLRDIPVADATMNKRHWSRSYLNLTNAKIERAGNYQSNTPEGGLVTWISKMSRPTELPPKFSGAIQSPLLKMLDKGHHGVSLTEVEYQKLATWMDLLVPFCGTYREANQWSQDEMRFYDYFEEKRRLQHEEERGLISKYLASLTAKPPTESKNTPSSAAFTDAIYQQVPANIVPGTDDKTILRVSAESPFLFDRLSLQVEANEPVTVTLRHRDKALHKFTFEPGNTTQAWHSGGAPLRNQDMELQVTGKIANASIEVHGISENKLPEINGYKRHLEFAN